MSTKIYSLILSWWKYHVVKAILYLGVEINIYLYFPYVLSKLYEIQYKSHFSTEEFCKNWCMEGHTFL
jgi:fucose permease